MSRRKRPKAKHNQYGDRDQPIYAKVSEVAKLGLQDLATRQGVSLNELFELLGRGQISQSILSGESCAN